MLRFARNDEWGNSNRHCEEPTGDQAIHTRTESGHGRLDCACALWVSLPLAMTSGATATVIARSAVTKQSIHRHCEERSDEAIHTRRRHCEEPIGDEAIHTRRESCLVSLDCFASLAMTSNVARSAVPKQPPHRHCFASLATTRNVARSARTEAKHQSVHNDPDLSV